MHRMRVRVLCKSISVQLGDMNKTVYPSTHRFLQNTFSIQVKPEMASKEVMAVAIKNAVWHDVPSLISKVTPNRTLIPNKR